MNKYPLVSIIMPVYQVEKYIEDSIKSVLRQSYSNIELIVVDDGSLDHSIKIAEKILSESDFDYRVVRQENEGLGRARNAGLLVAKGEWIFFLDSDDLISDNTIEHLTAVICNDDVDLVFSTFNEISNVSEIIQECEKGKKELISGTELQMQFLKRKKVVLAPGTLYRRLFLLENNLFFEAIPWSEDQHFMWRVLFHVNKAAFLDEPLYQYLRHSGSIMNGTKAEAMSESFHAICELEDYYAIKPEIGKFIVPRWVMGTMNSAAKNMPILEWKKLWKLIKGKENCKVLVQFPDIKTKIMGLIACISSSLYYYLIKIIFLHLFK